MKDIKDFSLNELKCEINKIDRHTIENISAKIKELFGDIPITKDKKQIDFEYNQVRFRVERKNGIKISPIYKISNFCGTIYSTAIHDTLEKLTKRIKRLEEKSRVYESDIFVVDCHTKNVISTKRIKKYHELNNWIRYHERLIEDEKRSIQSLKREKYNLCSVKQ